MSNPAGRRTLVGVVGVGRMGLPIAGRVANAGYDVVCHDMNHEVASRAAASGLLVVQQCEELLSTAEVALLLVDSEQAIHDIVELAISLRRRGCRASALIVHATVRPTFMTELGTVAADAGIEILDAPVCKGEPAARDGSLLVMAGGDPAVYEKLRPILDCFASDCFLLGPLGAGQVGKLVNNLVLWASISVTTEGLRLAKAMGVDPPALVEALLHSSGRTWALETWYRPREMPWAEKDMQIILSEAARLELELPVARVVRTAISEVKARRAEGEVV